NAQEMMIARLRSQPIPIRSLRPDVPDPVEKALTKSLQTDPDDRFSTALEFGDALTGGAGGSAGGAGDASASSGGFFGKLKEKFS
ncbi:MAG TPA: hypothetical protein VE714_01500, partial [Gemmatimonadales bacterium]|nr:hypothetical protein [Gemmatimonadales bacterium]